MRDKCPFCGAGSSYSGQWRCGTKKAQDINGEYTTGTECDKSCFRDSLIKCTNEKEQLEREVERLREETRLQRIASTWLENEVRRLKTILDDELDYRPDC